MLLQQAGFTPYEYAGSAYFSVFGFAGRSQNGDSNTPGIDSPKLVAAGPFSLPEVDKERGSLLARSSCEAEFGDRSSEARPTVTTFRPYDCSMSGYRHPSGSPSADPSAGLSESRRGFSPYESFPGKSSGVFSRPPPAFYPWDCESANAQIAEGGAEGARSVSSASSRSNRQNLAGFSPYVPPWEANRGGAIRSPDIEARNWLGQETPHLGALSQQQQANTSSGVSIGNSLEISHHDSHGTSLSTYAAHSEVAEGAASIAAFRTAGGVLLSEGSSKSAAQIFDDPCPSQPRDSRHFAPKMSEYLLPERSDGSSQFGDYDYSSQSMLEFTDEVSLLCTLLHAHSALLRLVPSSYASALAACFVHPW